MNRKQRTGHEIIEDALKKAAEGNPGDAPAQCDYNEGQAYMRGMAAAYQHALEMIPAPIVFESAPACIKTIATALKPNDRFKPTPGEWVADGREGWAYPNTVVRTPQEREEGGHTIVRVHADFTCTVGKSEYEWANAAFVAACSPKNIAELLAYVTHLEDQAASDRHAARVQNAKLMAMTDQPGGIARLREVLEAARPEHPPNEKLMQLADKIDHEQLWRRSGIDFLEKMTPEQQDSCTAGVMLRRYADLLGNDGWRIFPPRRGVCFRASTLDKAVEMAREDEMRRHDANWKDAGPGQVNCHRCNYPRRLGLGYCPECGVVAKSQGG